MCGSGAGIGMGDIHRVSGIPTVPPQDRFAFIAVVVGTAICRAAELLFAVAAPRRVEQTAWAFVWLAACSPVPELKVDTLFFQSC